MGTQGLDRPSSRPRRGGRAVPVVVAWGLLALAGGLAACGGGGGPAPATSGDDALIVARADSFMEELAGPQFAALSQAQRWRAVASLGTGLPPSGFTPADLPEPNSTGAGLLQAYCTQCHWLPTPRMHSADEWPILLRRMVLRMNLLEGRVHGPFLSRVGGDALRSAVTFRSMPSEEQLDTLQAYLTRNALPVARAGEVGTGERASLFLEKCTVCHQTPSPGAHPAAVWDTLVPRMQKNMRLMQVDTLTTAQMRTIQAYLGEHGAG